MKIKLLSYFAAFIFVCLACSTDVKDQDNLNDLELLQSKIYLNLPSDAPNYDEFYEYDNGLLTSASGYTSLLGNYSYSKEGRLESMQNEYEYFTYEYDTQGRLSKQKEVGTNNYIALSYEKNKVITHKYYEYGNNNSVSEERELFLDNEGRIVKMVNLTPEEGEEIIYEYDNRGNIIKTITTSYENAEEIIRNYTYEDIKNPYYDSFYKFYQKTYYLNFYLGLQIQNNYGTTPYLIKDENQVFEVNEKNYPFLLHKQVYDDTYEIQFNYYE